MKVWCWIASLGGVGFFPKMPGTMGSLVSLSLWWGLSYMGMGPIVYGLGFIAVFGVAVYAAERACGHWGQWDDQRIVIDELVGMGVACFGLRPHQYVWFVVAFALFRFFDIVKPWPANYFDRRKSGFAVVMDDVVAGVYALAVVQILATW